MKRLLLSLFAALLIGQARAASTDTITVVTDQIIADIEAAPAIVPVEQKVVELHVTWKPEVASALAKATKVRGRKVERFATQATCSGAFVSDHGDIITAKHCTEGSSEIEVVTYDRRTYVATVTRESKVHDLALIHIDRRDTAYFLPALQIVRGETVSILGSPLGITDTLSTGIIARIDGDLTLVDCSALPGNSGGPLFDKDERLVGILTAGFVVLFGTTHLNVAQGSDAIWFFIMEAMGFSSGLR